jgi:hypothetical protein
MDVADDPAEDSQPATFYFHQRTKVRTLMLRRGDGEGGLVGSSNEVCAVRRATPSDLGS